MSGPPRRTQPIVSNSAGQKTCPCCRLLVEVRAGLIENHQRFSRDQVRGLVNRMPVHGVEPCAAGGGSYAWWLDRVAQRNRRAIERAAKA
jgi:hypothetical protein